MPSSSTSNHPIYLDAPPSPPLAVSPKDYALGQDDTIVPVPTPPDDELPGSPSSSVVNNASERLRKELKVEETIDTSGKRRGRFARYMMAELDKETTRIPLAINCFLSGCEWNLEYMTRWCLIVLTRLLPPFPPVIGSVTFSATSVWYVYCLVVQADVCWGMYKLTFTFFDVCRVGYQTGNTVQTAMAISRTIFDP